MYTTIIVDFNPLTPLLYVTKSMTRIKVCILSIDIHYCNIYQDNFRTIFSKYNIVHLPTKPI